jgi:leader peptidase (prepilin peptidase)/N-methyltransferase
MDALRLGLTALAALPAGWFAGVLVDRIPDARPLWRPRPSISSPIDGSPGRSGAVYVVTLGLFLLAAVRFEDLAQLIPYLFVFTVLTALSFIDLETLRLPDRLVFPTLGVSVVMLLIASLVLDSPSSLRYAALGSLVYFAFLFVAHIIYPPGMGFGDVKLALIMGMYLGWLGASTLDTMVLLLYGMLIGFLLGSIAGVAVFVIRRRSRGYPFGPFLAVGTVATILMSESLLAG